MLFIRNFEFTKKIGSTMPPHQWKTNLQWSDLAFELPTQSRLVLRHNKQLQYGDTPAAGETLGEALQKMEVYCKAHKV